jgi:hypothetical protein
MKFSALIETSNELFFLSQKLDYNIDRIRRHTYFLIIKLFKDVCNSQASSFLELAFSEPEVNNSFVHNIGEVKCERDYYYNNGQHNDYWLFRSAKICIFHDE